MSRLLSFLLLLGTLQPTSSFASEFAQQVISAMNAADHRVEQSNQQNQTDEQPFVIEDEADINLNLLADIRVHSASELLQILTQVDSLFTQGSINAGTESPVVFLLHGNEAKTLFRSNYQKNKSVVDLAAKLSAFGVVDIKVCETWAGNQGLDKSKLQPFVDTVPYAPAAEKRLVEEQGYVYF